MTILTEFQNHHDLYLGTFETSLLTKASLQKDMTAVAILFPPQTGEVGLVSFVQCDNRPQFAHLLPVQRTVITSTPAHPPPEKKSSILCKTQVASAQKPVVQPPNYVSRLFSFAPSAKNSCFSTPFPLPCCIPGLKAWLTSLLLTTGISVYLGKSCRCSVAPDSVLLPRGQHKPRAPVPLSQPIWPACGC